jgi:DnaJ-class molecular chaperone
MNTKQLTYHEWLDITGIKPIIEECYYCDGDGEIECDECDGNESIECCDCNGTGEEIECPECDGEGEVPCPECEGDGKIECPECDGKKVVDKRYEIYELQYEKDTILINKLNSNKGK